MASRRTPEAVRRLMENIRTTFTTTKEWLDNPQTNKTVRDLRRRIKHLEERYLEFSALNEELLLSDANETGNISADTESMYLDVVARLETLLDDMETTNSANGDDEVGSNYHSCKGDNKIQIRLPKLSLPEFTGKDDDWSSFHQRFTTALKNEQITDLQRFEFLMSCLKGEAADLIKNIPLLGENYDEAMTILSRRYDNKLANMRHYLQNLFSLPQTIENSESSLRSLINITTCNIRALENLNYKRDRLSNELVAQLIVIKLDTRTRELWETTLTTFYDQADAAEIDIYERLLKFLEERLHIISSVFAKSSASASATLSQVKQRTPVRNKAVLLSQSSTTESSPSHRTCPVCNKDHALYKCDDFKKLSIADRYNLIRRCKLCVNCFSKSHWANACTSSKCKECSQNHHTLLHPARPAPSSVPTITTPETQVATSFPAPTSNNVAPVLPASSGALATSGAPVISAVAQRHLRDVLLSTARVHAASNSNVSEVTALLDGASHVTLITTELARRLRLPLENSSIRISGLGGLQSSATATTTLRISSRDDTFAISMHAVVVDHITEPLPAVSFTPPSTWDFIKQYPLADPTFSQSKAIDVLIGADYLYETLLSSIITQANAPTLVGSKFGWLLAGPYSASTLSVTTRCMNVVVTSTELDKLTKFWELEDPPSIKQPSVRDLACEELFKNTHTRVDGCFSVRLPFANTNLGDSYQLARKRLARCNITDEYSTFMREYEALGHMSRVNTPLGSARYYIPHHAVYKDDKIRVVFDASMPTTNGNSLNDCLLPGPALQANVFVILIKFRTFRFVFTTDIVKMFRQILIHKEDRVWQHILWRIGNEIVEYELNTVTYGMNCAPYLAIRCILQLTEEGTKTHPAAAAALKEGCYVDDTVTGADTLDDAIKLRDELIELLATAGMTLDKWKSNDPRLLPHGTVPTNEVTKTLGILWNVVSDEIYLQQPPLPTTCTKRSVASQLASLFDPLGILAPIIISGKYLLQSLWSKDIDWDTPLDQTIAGTFNQFANDIQLAVNTKVTRHVFAADTSTFELHCFSDASKQAYAACIYVRSISSNGEVSSNLLCSKTRLAPVRNKRTIPELELCAAALLAELIVSVSSLLQCETSRCFAYTDSTIVLAFLAKNPDTWKVFVANRVRKILPIVPRTQWYHISGDKNPADIATRCQSFSTFQHRQELWFKGPDFLRESTLPEQAPIELDDAALADARVSSHIITTATNGRTSEIQDVANHIISICSEFTRARRMVMALLRVKDFLIAKVKKTNLPKGSFTVDEVERAERVLVQAAQHSTYAKEISCLRKKQPLPKKSHLKTLTPFLEGDILRVKGRISRADLSYDLRHPMILPASHRLTLLLIRDCHFRFLHAGAQFIDTHLRRHFWIVGQLLPRLQKCIRTCARCIRFLRNPQRIPPMADLPASRVRPSYPFAEVGVDYAGPFLRKPEIRTRASTELKTYVAVFCCFPTRAVHLEAVTDLTTMAFLAALSRFVGRRGYPRTIHSDNGTNFTGAARELQRQFDALSSSTSIQNFAVLHRIRWQFNPPSSPHMGGLWEAAVKSMKFHLKKTMGEQKLTLDEFSTLLVQIEAILNSRPMTRTLASSTQLDTLTPGHFIIGRPMVALPETSGSNARSWAQRWALLSTLRMSFWRRWGSEYLRTMQRRGKWIDPVRTYQVNDIVLLEENTPPLTWPLARVTRVFPSSDGVVRVVEVVSRNGSVYRRPVSKLIPLVDDDYCSTADTPSTAAGNVSV